MKEYNSVSEPFLADVRAVVGDANVFTEPEKLEQYKTDEEYDPRRFRVPEAVVRPANAEEIAAVVKLCNKYNGAADCPQRRYQPCRWRNCCMRRYCTAHGALE